MPRPPLLITQSFIVGAAGSYWDYRDYIFCLCSHLAVKNFPVRLNLEKGTEFAPELLAAAEHAGFTDCEITTQTPPAWSTYMLAQVRKNPTTWVMPWPGDHIYIHPQDSAFMDALRVGEQLGADAVAYSHVQDFEYFLDWSRINILHNDPEYVLIEWGHRHKYRRNASLNRAALKAIGRPLLMTPVPGFVVYRASLFEEILEALPKITKRWQDMEFSQARSAASYKLLVPKKCLYRHVHGYWLEGFFKYQHATKFPSDTRAEIESWYIRPEYDWRREIPSRQAYRQMCLDQHPYFQRYIDERRPGAFPNEFATTPFDPNWNPTRTFGVQVKNFFKNAFSDKIRAALGSARDLA